MKRVVALALLFVITITAAVPSEARLKKVYLGKVYVSTYHASDNTPRGSRATSSGKKATVGRTVAVDAKNPVVPMGAKVKIQGLGKRTVEDTGGFGRYNNGQRKFDVYMPEGKGFLKKLKAWYLRPETKKERKARIKRARIKAKKRRRKRQRGWFTLRWSMDLPQNVMATDPKWIHKGTVRIGSLYFEVRKYEKGLGNVILVGDEDADGIKVKLDEVVEGVKG